MRTSSVFLFPAFLFLMACRGPEPQETRSPSPAADSLSAELNRLYQQGLYNGFSVAVVSDSGILYKKGFGYSDVATKKPYTEQTIQNVGSVSKVFIGLALMKAQELGKLKLDDAVSSYLPFKVENPRCPDIPITIRQLATHTSGIIDNGIYLTKNYFFKPGELEPRQSLVFDSTQVFMPSDSAVPLPVYLERVLSPQGRWYRADGFGEHKPGTIYEYSNTGATLAAYIIERATGQSFSDFTNTYIFKPLRMDASGWRFSEVDLKRYSRLYENPGKPLPYYGMTTYPDGNLISSADDLGKFLAELIRGYKGKGTLLSQESYREFFRPQLSDKQFIDRNEQNPYSESYNVGIFIGQGYTGYIGHTGGDPGLASLLFFDPKRGCGRLLIVNTSITGQPGFKVFFGIWDLLEKYQAQLH